MDLWYEATWSSLFSSLTVMRSKAASRCDTSAMLDNGRGRKEDERGTRREERRYRAQ